MVAGAENRRKHLISGGVIRRNIVHRLSDSDKRVSAALSNVALRHASNGNR